MSICYYLFMHADNANAACRAMTRSDAGPGVPHTKEMIRMTEQHTHEHVHQSGLEEVHIHAHS
jgi:hypothetical protein